MTLADRVFSVVTLPFLFMIGVLLTCLAYEVQWPVVYLAVSAYVASVMLRGYYEVNLSAEAMIRAGAMFVVFLACYFPHLSLNNVTVIILPAVVLFIGAGFGIVAESRVRRRK